MEVSKVKEFYDGLDSDLKETTSGKSVKKYLDTQSPKTEKKK